MDYNELREGPVGWKHPSVKPLAWARASVTGAMEESATTWRWRGNLFLSFLPEERPLDQDLCWGNSVSSLLESQVPQRAPGLQESLD